MSELRCRQAACDRPWAEPVLFCPYCGSKAAIATVGGDIARLSPAPQPTTIEVAPLVQSPKRASSSTVKVTTIVKVARSSTTAQPGPIVGPDETNIDGKWGEVVATVGVPLAPPARGVKPEPSLETPSRLFEESLKPRKAKKKGRLFWKLAAGFVGIGFLGSLIPTEPATVHTLQVSSEWTTVPIDEWNSDGRSINLVTNRAYRLRVGDKLLYGEPGGGIAIETWPSKGVEVRFADHQPGEMKFEIGGS